MKRLKVLIAVLLWFIFSFSHAKTIFISIGSGGLTGVYFPLAGQLSKFINKKSDVYGIRCSHESTGGSVFNINAILRGDLEFGIAQSDRQYQAYKGLAEWKVKGPQTKIRSVFSLHPESITLIASKRSGIKSLMELKGKRVNIGNVGSGQRQNAIDVLKNYGIDYKKDLRVEQVKASEAPSLLQDGRIDAFFYTVGHPNGNIKEATSGREKVNIIPIKDSKDWLHKYPYFNNTRILIKYYPNALNKEDIETIGVVATLVTSINVTDEIVYALTKEVFENFEQFKKTHPALDTITKVSMLKGHTAPFHPGALKYYKEAGLMK